jgi:two-component system, OmpR family, sensor kinase
MQFDDRLTTVLRQRASGKSVPSIQYRQLLDLLGTLPTGAQGQKLDAAFLRLAELSKSIPATERAAILRDVGVRLRNPRLLAALAAGEPIVAVAALSNAQLSENEWIDLVPALPVHSRSLLRQQRTFTPRVNALLDRLGLTPLGLPQASVETEVQADNAPSSNGHAGEIGAIVRKIEDFRRLKLENAQHIPSHKPAKNQQSDHRPSAFDFATDAEGRITWSDPGMAHLAVGLNLNAQFWFAGNVFHTALTRHQPIFNESVFLGGGSAISGRWGVDAKPDFDPLSGRFLGYSGRFRRLQPNKSADTPIDHRTGEADRMRQILHELRTPVGAIQGFAEVIHQQIFGPTPHAYRALAASIAADAARILAGFEELDYLAKLESGVVEWPSGACDFSEVVKRTVAQLKSYTDARNSSFILHIPVGSESLMTKVPQATAEHLCWRFLGTLAGLMGPGEVLDVSLTSMDDLTGLLIQLPAGTEIFEQVRRGTVAVNGQVSALTTGMFGAGFTLRLVAAEAKSLGGALIWQENTVELSLPGLTRTTHGNSEKAMRAPHRGEI